MSVLTPFDRLQAFRALSYGAMAAFATLAIAVTTDEQYSSAATRLARMAAMTPLLGAVAVLATARHAASNGEARALEAVGLPPWRIATGAVVAAWLFAAVGALLLAAPVTDVRALFPVLSASTTWIPDGHGALASPDLGIAVRPDGTLAFIEGIRGAHPVAPGRRAALALVIPAGVVAPLWAAVPASWWPRAVALATCGAAAIAALHVLAANRASAVLCVVPAAILAAHGLAEHAVRR
jgi:hypothetical protein